MEVCKRGGHFSFVAVQLLSCVWLFATSWTAAHQASLSFTISRSLLSLMSTESVMPSNHLILFCPLLLLSFPASGSFPVSWLFASGGHIIGASVSASVLPMNIQDWFPLGLTSWISLELQNDCGWWWQHEMKRHLLLGRKTMTYLVY